jgi:hypothetical protein
LPAKPNDPEKSGLRSPASAGDHIKEQMGKEMTKPLVMDAYAQVLAEDTIQLLAKETPKAAPKLVPIDKHNFELTSPARRTGHSRGRLRP